MIGYLKGTVLDSGEGRLLLGSGDGASVVGYDLHVPASSSYSTLLPGERVELFVYTHVREDALDLYGFLSRPEKELFLTLIQQVNGIGPRVGLAVLSAASPASLVQAVLDEDKALLTRIPGIGKKTAERMILELADPIRKRVTEGKLPAGDSATKGATGKAASGASASAHLPAGVRDARQALLGLGYREIEVDALLEQAVKERGAVPAEELIRAALRQLG